MSVNWMTVVAQICNFLILIWLLKRFLYGPILRAMDTRQRHLAELQEAAHRKSAEAEETIETYTTLLSDLEKEKHRILSDANVAAEREHQTYLEHARGEVERIKHDWIRSMHREQSTFLQQGRILIGRGACQLARTILRDLAETDLERAIVAVFMEKLRTLSPEQQRQLRVAAEPDGAPIRIHSSFAFDVSQQEQLAAVLLPLAEATGPIDFVVSDSLIAGIELDVGDQHYGWSIEEYLHELEQSLQRYIEKGLPLPEHEHA